MAALINNEEVNFTDLFWKECHVLYLIFLVRASRCFRLQLNVTSEEMTVSTEELRFSHMTSIHCYIYNITMT